MAKLLVQGCSKAKNEATEPVPAFDLYDGYFYKILKKSIREDSLRSDFDICILSAEHGLIDFDTEIAAYERKMTADRADKLRPELTAQLRERVRTNEYEHVFLNLGATYERAVEGFAEPLEVPVTYVSGQLGERGRTLKQLVRTDKSCEVVA